MVSSVKSDATHLIKTLPDASGVYQMLNADNQIIYVGKAKNLKKRVSSYFQKTSASIKTQQLVKQVEDIQIIITNTETEALLLEINLIKKHRPKYNVCFRDDKSYPYLYLSTTDDYPALSIHRGAKRKTGKYFGPYPNAYAARETVNLLQKIFKIRSCKNTFFKNRTRPCLQYQINRCTAPCVGFVKQDNYQRDIEHVKYFLHGKSSDVITHLVKQMEILADQQAYEAAAVLRDQIQALRTVQQPQAISHDSATTCDVIAIITQINIASIAVLTIRSGQITGSQHYFIKVAAEISSDDVWTEFIPQYYLDEKQTRVIPGEIIISQQFVDLDMITAALSEVAKHKVTIKSDVRAIRAQWLEIASNNAFDALQRREASHAQLANRFAALAQAVDCPQSPRRIECFDVSHTFGEATQAACVVFNEQGALKTDYRRYNITDITPGDDYAALRQALTRRYRKHQTIEKIPDILLIDGGKGQLRIALEVLAECHLPQVIIIGVAKGVTRKPGLETLFIHESDAPLHLPPDSAALHLIQQIRDEAHRFAITGHRQRRKKNRQQSSLETIPGVGPKRRKQLIHHFGGLQGVLTASIQELSRIPGINAKLAEEIFTQLRDKKDT